MALNDESKLLKFFYLTSDASTCYIYKRKRKWVQFENCLVQVLNADNKEVLIFKMLHKDQLIIKLRKIDI